MNLGDRILPSIRVIRVIRDSDTPVKLKLTSQREHGMI